MDRSPGAGGNRQGEQLERVATRRMDSPTSERPAKAQRKEASPAHFDSMYELDSMSDEQEEVAPALFDSMHEFDSMFDEQEKGNVESCKKTFTALGAAIKDETDDKKKAELWWRQARACFDVQDCKLGDMPFREKWIREGVKFAEKAIEADVENGYAHKWLAIMVGTLRDMPSLGQTEKIKGAHRVKEHADKALNLIKPVDHNVLLMLAIWCYTVAGLSWALRMAAAVFFHKPPTSSWDEALWYATRCCDAQVQMGKLQARPAFIRAMCYLQKGNKADAKVWFMKAQEVESSTETDETYKKEAEEELKKLNVA